MLLLLCILTLIGTVVAVPSLYQAHAAAGTVCVVAKGATGCPTTSPSLISNPNTNLTISINIQGSDLLSGFDIILLAPHAILKPLSADATGTVLPAPTSTVVECVAGILVIGNSCSPTDNMDTIHFAVVDAPGTFTTAPTSGLLFTATFRVVSTGSGTIGYQPGCSAPTSVSNTCITIANGSTTPDSEIASTASFSTSTKPDFTISAHPSSLVIPGGTTATSTIILTSVNSFAGTVNLGTSGPPLCPSPQCPSWSISLTSVQLAPNANASTTLTIVAGLNPATFNVTVTGTKGNLSHSVSVIFREVSPPPPDYTLSANPNSLTIPPGSTSTSTISAASVSGFTGTISLAATVSQSGPSVSLNPTSITLSSGGTGSTILTIATSKSTPPGNYAVGVTGISGPTSHTTTISLTVTGGGDFNVTDSATAIAIPVSSERQTIVTVTSVNGFSGNVNLVATPSSTAFACWFTTLTNTATVFVPAGGSAQQYPTCGAGRPAGAYTLSITGTSTGQSHSAVLNVNVTDFDISAPSVGFNAGSPMTSSIVLSSLYRFSSTVNLSVSSSSPALTVSCGSSVFVPPGGRAMTPCTYSSSTPGTYSVTYTGTSTCIDCYYNGVDTNTRTGTVNVFGTAQPDFTISANPTNLSFPSGSSAMSTISVSPLNGFSGTVSLTVSPLSSFLTATITPASTGPSGTATLTVSSSIAGTYTATVTGTSGALSHSVTVSIVVTSGALVGTVCIVAIGATDCGPGQVVLTGAVDTNLTVAVSIQNSDSLNGFDIILLAPRMSLAPVSADLSGTVLPSPYSVVLYCIGGRLVVGFSCSPADTADTIHLSVNTNPGGFTPRPTTGLLFSATYRIASTGSATLGYQIGCGASTSVSNTCITITNGSATPLPENAQTASFVASTGPDFTLNIDLASITIQAGSSGMSTVIATSINGFAGTISLSSASPAGGLTSSLNPASIVLSSGSRATATLTVSTTSSTPAGTYVVTVTGVSGTLTRQVSQSVTVTVPVKQDYTMIAHPDAISLAPGSSGTSTINLQGLNGFNGTVFLSVSTSNGITATINPTSTGPYGHAILIVSAATIGSYNVVVTGTSGSLSHSVTIFVSVTSPGTNTVVLSNDPNSADWSGYAPTWTLTPDSFLDGQGLSPIIVSTTSFSADRTVETDFKTVTAGNAQPWYVAWITPKWQDYYDKIVFDVYTGGTVEISIHYGNNPTSHYFNTTNLSPLAWHHAKIVISGNTIKAYVDGVLYISANDPLVGALGASKVSLASWGPSESEFNRVTVTQAPPPVDFSISSSPYFVSLVSGNSGTSTINLSSLNGFTGTINLSVSTSPTVTDGPTTSLSQSSISIATGGTGSSTLKVSSTNKTPGDSYTLTVTATSGSISHSVLITVTVTRPADFAFSDDFNYASISALQSAGWTLCGGGVIPPGYYQVNNGSLTLTNDGNVGSMICYSKIPQHVQDWSISARGEWVGQTYGSIELTARTTNHTYTWDADGYYNQFILLRDNLIVFRADGYTPQLNVFHTLRLDMTNSTLTFYFDGRQIGTYQETTPGTALTIVMLPAGWISIETWDYITVSQKP